MTKEYYELSEITCLDIQDRFGTFLAIRWPAGKPPEYDDIVVLQDIFRVVFGYLFEDPGLMKSRVPPATTRPRSISGASVDQGIIHGGFHDGEPLYLGP